MRRRELTGQVFGHLTVLGLDGIRKGHSYWKVRCDCGVEKAVSGSHLVRNNLKSCGCAVAKGAGHSSFRGHGKVTQTYFGNIIRGANGAKGRPPKEFTITIEYIADLFDKQGGLCALSGMPLDFTSKKETASLDRIDSSKGYIEGNVQWVHKDINMMKRNYDQDYFIDICNKVAQHIRGCL